MLSDLNAERLKYILMNMDDAVLATRMNGELLYANPAAEKLFGFSAGKRVRIWESVPLIAENDELVELFISGIMKKEKSFRSLVDYVNRSGDRFRLHVSLTCDSEGDGMFLVVISDLTAMIRVHSAFKRYTSPEIADYVLTAPGGEKQGGSDREVTILMSDLRGFTHLSTRLSSSELITMLNHYFESMSAVIDYFRGTVIEFLGDGIFVVFGAPKDLPDHASAAVSCAVGMQNAMADVNRWNRDHGFPELEMGIGIHSGTAVVGNIGSDKRMKYGCMGEVVNLAGRLESYTVGGQVFVSEATARMVSEPLTIADEKRFMPKGASQEMTFYDITGIGSEQMFFSSEPVVWTALPVREIAFCILDGKSVDPARYIGRLTHISPDGKYAFLLSSCALQPFRNLMFRIGDQDIYAKVMSSETADMVPPDPEFPFSGENKYRLCITAKPDHLIDLLKS